MTSPSPRAPRLDGIRAVFVNWRDPGHSLAGGSERYAWEFSRGLAEAGADVTFFTARDRHQAACETIDGIRVVRAGSQFGFYVRAWAHLLRNRWSPRAYDVVVDAENGIPAFAPLVVARATRVLLVVHHIHLEQFRTYFRRPLSDVGRLLEGRLMPRVYRRVPTYAVSDSTAEGLRRRLGWRTPVRILANGSDGLDEQPSGEREDRIVVFGRLATHKRVDLVLRALEPVLEERPGLRVDVIGGGPELDRIRGLASAVRADQRVAVHGFAPEELKVRLLRTALLNVCGSDAEGWGQVVVEAASYGIPTVARDVPGLRDSIRDGRTGWLVRPGSDRPEAVVRALEQGVRRALDELSDPARARQVADECHAWASQFTWPAMRRHAVDAVADALSRP
jgi:glycosyltransferase involved in cell wall biosynthesis